MKDSEKAFIDYCKGYKYREIAEKRGVELGTVKSWSQRGIAGVKWVDLKAKCTDEDTGEIDMEKAKSFVSGKGNLSPTNAGSNTFPSVYSIPNTEENRAFISNTVKNSVRYFNIGIPKSDFEVQVRIEGYFNTCISEGIIPTVEGLSNCLGISTSTLWDWETNKRNSGTVRSDLIKNAKACIQEFDAQMAISGKMRDVTYIFRAKNYYGMKDQVDTVVTHNNVLGSTADKNEIANRIAEQADNLPDDG